MTSQEKREEIIDLAWNCHRSLERHLAEEGKLELLREGGNLLLGRHYAESSTIYFGLNPGSIGGEAPPFVPNFDGKSGPNPPFDSSDDFA